ncbi:MAG TPA: adenylyl-sulfate kinase [Desulfomonilaceae bacterium]|nr:adenylyl-sulfate kinase [Desulfomonilaceae bacterium]
MNIYEARTIWFTGLSGSGKSTLSVMLKQSLESRGISVALLDGDLLRQGLNRDLSFSAADRAENIRRAGEVAKILCDEGFTVLAAFITPLESLRQALRNIFEPGRFVEVFLECPLSICEARDCKGLYARARRGEIPEFTGISSPFEPPTSSDLVVPTGSRSAEECLDLLNRFLNDEFPELEHSKAAPACARSEKPRMAVIGLDCVPPFLVFDEFRDCLPNLTRLMEHGGWGTLESTVPPITVPAWTSMTTGRDPGELGLYGFRNRLNRHSLAMSTVNSTHVTSPRVWNYLEDEGYRSILIGIPQTYPAQAHEGITIADFLAPDMKSEFTYPPHLAADLAFIAGGEYLMDVKEFRTRDKDALLNDIHTMMDRRFRVASDLLIHEPWDFFMMVEIAPDRLHHAFWRFCRPDHRLFEPGNPYEGVLRDFYCRLDARLGSLLALMDDNTAVMVVSDHGVRNMEGGICINEWLLRNGYLVLVETTRGTTSVGPDLIDWSRTRAWSEGGYYARVFINVQGREPQGIVRPGDYEALRNELADKIACLPDEYGSPLCNQVFKPEDVYRSVRNVAPDLLVYFDGLSRRSVGTVGHGTIHLNGNDTGPDDANHDREGIFIAARMSDVRTGKRGIGRINGLSCLDITPTVLSEFGVSVPSHMGGRVIRWDERLGERSLHTDTRWVAGKPTQPKDHIPPTGYTSEEEEIIKKRLMDLGYL